MDSTTSTTLEQHSNVESVEFSRWQVLGGASTGSSTSDGYVNLVDVILFLVDLLLGVFDFVLFFDFLPIVLLENLVGLVGPPTITQWRG